MTISYQIPLNWGTSPIRIFWRQKSEICKKFSASLLVSCESAEIHSKILHVAYGVHKITLPSSGVSVVFNDLFRLTLFCSLPKLFAVKLKVVQKWIPNFHAFGLSNFKGDGPRDFGCSFSKYTHFLTQRKFGGNQLRDFRDYTLKK